VKFGLDTPKEFSQGDLESHGDLFDVNERKIALTSLDSTHIGPVQAAQVGEFLLRHL
jgi:hypothetical protein